VHSSSATYVPRLDHLRFFAVLLVLGWHSIHANGAIPFNFVPSFFALSIFEEGHTGVSLFLTLSGFIFARLCDGHGVIYSSFIRNRLLRVAPLLIVWTLVNYPLSQLPPERMLAMLVLLTTRGDFPGLGWTALIEVQLYFVFPFLLRFSHWYGPKYLLGIVLVALMLRTGVWMTTGTLPVGLVTTSAVQLIAYWTAVGRVDEFVLGMLGFEVSRRWGRQIGHPLVMLALCTGWLFICHRMNLLGGYYFSPATPQGQMLWIYFPTLEGLFYGLITASYLNLPLPRIQITSRFFAWLGTLSYSAYLNHWMIVQGCFLWAPRFGLMLASPVQIIAFTCCVVLPLVIACSALTYYVIEMPFLRLRTQYLTTPAPTPAVAAT
jgi:peptidoglycan/LPS O-acetylase OafA/YrhL